MNDVTYMTCGECNESIPMTPEDATFIQSKNRGQWICPLCGYRNSIILSLGRTFDKMRKQAIAKARTGVVKE